MNISIIGAGRMGIPLGKKWAHKGHNIFYNSLKNEDAKSAALNAGNNSKYGTLQEAFHFSKVIVFAIPYSSVNAVLKNFVDLSDKIIVDCINPTDSNFNLLLGFNTSASEEIQKIAKGASIVKALNVIASPVLDSENTLFDGQKTTVFYCGDDLESKKIVSELLSDLDFEPVDSGELKSARYLEPLAGLIIELAIKQNLGANIALKLLKR
jgi:8-hydroxy-5-deazaflavin:NADPH oxidoreductase